MVKYNQLSGSPTLGKRSGETRNCYTGPTAEFVAEKALGDIVHKSIAGKSHFKINIDRLENGQWRTMV